MKQKNEDKINELNIESVLDLQRFLLNEWLELITSGNENQKVIALKELSKYSFPSSTYEIAVERVLKDEFHFLNIG